MILNTKQLLALLLIPLSASSTYNQLTSQLSPLTPIAKTLPVNRNMTEEELLRELFNPNMTEEEMRIRDLMGEIDKVIPEDRLSTFWEKVEKKSVQLEEATAHMNQDEKRAYLHEAYALKETRPPYVYTSSAFKKPIPKSPKPPAKVKLTKKEKKSKAKLISIKEPVDANKIIKSIITSIKNFLKKTATIAHFESKVNSWAKQNLVSDWPAKQTWNSFENDLSKFSSLLERFQEADIKFGTKHIDALSKNETIVQNLQQVEIKLTRELQIINKDNIAGMDIKKKTKNAVAHIINALTQALYQIKLNESLQKIIEKFDPTATGFLIEEEKSPAKPNSKSDFTLPSINFPAASRGELEPQRLNDTKVAQPLPPNEASAQNTAKAMPTAQVL